MHILITGGLGYIGSRIGARMRGEGHQVTILDNLSTSVVREVADVIVRRVDLRDESQMASLDLPPADCLMHLAGPSSGPASAKDPVGTISDGYRVTYNTLELAQRLGNRGGVGSAHGSQRQGADQAMGNVEQPANTTGQAVGSPELASATPLIKAPYATWVRAARSWGCRATCRSPRTVGPRAPATRLEETGAALRVT